MMACMGIREDSPSGKREHGGFPCIRMVTTNTVNQLLCKGSSQPQENEKYHQLSHFLFFQLG